ncbi:MAG TPA: helicase-related protein [Chloroflexia bacterium]|nr:helicase-related protein [Chloroflexia bacterium]
MTNDQLAEAFPAGTIITLEGRIPEPARLEAPPTRMGAYIKLRYVVVNKVGSYRSVAIPLQEFDKVKVIARPGQRNFDADPARFRLAIEAERLRLAYAYDPHFAVSISNIDALPHQIDAVYHRMLKMPRVKFLLADDPGAGKTIMAGLLLKELKFRKVVRRVLIVTPAALTEQWKGEMLEKFGESFRVISGGTVNDNVGINVWQDFDQVITSIDFAKQERVMASLENTEWDLVIVDEAHKMSAYRSGQDRKASERYKLGLTLSHQTNHLLLMTATPHRGDPDNFNYLLQLVDPDLFNIRHGENGQHEDEGRLIDRAKTVLVRRLKEQLKDFEGKPLYPPRTVTTARYDLSPAERTLYDAVTDYVGKGLFMADQVSDRNTGLALTTLQRRLASSLEAIDLSLKRRRDKLQNKLNNFQSGQIVPAYQSAAYDYDEEEEDLEEGLPAGSDVEGATTARTRIALEHEIQELDKLIALTAKAKAAGTEAKLNRLREILENPERRVIGGDEKLLIFTENKDTLDYLVRELRRWGLSVTSIHGQMKMQDRIAAEKEFKGPNCQVMVATEAAGEGINLHFCRLLINYDIPWNPNRLEQRMGRVHRYLQKRPVYIYNLVASKTREGDVLGRLLDKLDAMRLDLESDKVFDVIGTLLEGMNLKLDRIITDAIKDDDKRMEAMNVIDQVFAQQARDRLREATEEVLATPFVNTDYLADEKERSRLARLVPESSERFFKEACRVLGIRLEQRPSDGLWRIPTVPAFLRNWAAESGLTKPAEEYNKFTFFKHERKDDETILMSATHPLFDAVVEFIRHRYGPLLTAGTCFHEPGAPEAGSLWFFRGRVTDGNNAVVGEKLFAVRLPQNIAALQPDSPEEQAKLVYNPSALADLTLPEQSQASPVPLPGEILDGLLAGEEIALNNIIGEQLQPYLNELDERRRKNIQTMRRYIERNFDKLIDEANKKIFEQKMRGGQGENMAVAIATTQRQIDSLIEQKRRRLAELERESSLNMEVPELLGVALSLPVPVPSNLQDVMHSDKAVEVAAVNFVRAYEASFNREVTSVEEQDVGYDLESHPVEAGHDKSRYIEVKGRAGVGRVALTPNEWDTARRIGPDYWLYIVTDATGSHPQLRAIQNPANTLQAVEEVTVTRYIVPVEEYRRAAIEEKL